MGRSWMYVEGRAGGNANELTAQYRRELWRWRSNKWMAASRSKQCGSGCVVMDGWMVCIQEFHFRHFTRAVQNVSSHVI